MVKKSIRLLLVIVMITVSLSCICACNKEHKHKYKKGWVSDETYHWRVATCGDIDIGMKGLHNFIDGVCTLCGYEDPDYKPYEKPDIDEPEIDEPETEEPIEDPELPDDDPSNALRPPLPSDSEEDEPLEPEEDVLLDDSYYDFLFYPESEYTQGESATENGLTYTELIDEDKSFVGYAVSLSEESSCESEITIPEKYNDKPVIMVNKEGFKDCTSLTKVTLPEGMLYIGEGAFNGCTSLNSVTIPSTLWLISKKAFLGCKDLSEIDFGNVREIRYAAFKECSFTALTIPDSVHTIASGAFFDCKQLAEVTMGKGIKNVGGQAFCNCRNLKKVNISDLEAWCKIAFVYDNSNPLNYGADLYINGERATEIEIPEGCGVSKNVFSGCTSLEKVTIPSTAGKIGEYAFQYCTALEKVTFKEGAEELYSYAFVGCNKLTELVLPNSLKYIRRDAVYMCTKLTKIVFGTEISIVESYSFTQLPESAKFCYRGSEAEWQDVDTQSNWATGADFSKIEFSYTGQ